MGFFPVVRLKAPRQVAHEAHVPLSVLECVPVLPPQRRLIQPLGHVKKTLTARALRKEQAAVQR